MVARGALGALAALVLPLALLSACGDDSASTAADPASSGSTSATADPTPSESQTDMPLPDWPACADVWVTDATLPLAYKGCLDGTTPVKADNLSCSSGQRIVRYADRMYAVSGGKIYHADGPLDKDKQYLKMVRVCRA
jgi:hypothetical protein